MGCLQKKGDAYILTVLNRSSIIVNMNRLTTEERTRIVAALVEGNSIRSVVRMTGFSKNTIAKLLIEVGAACAVYQDQKLRNLKLKRIQCDEIWSFIQAKDKNVPENKKGQFGIGSVWTWTAIDSDTKLVPCWMVGPRDVAAATEFMQDLASRLANRVQLTTDGLKAYLTAVEDAFGSNIDYAMLIKIYGDSDKQEEKRYSPAECTGTKTEIVNGTPSKKHISTSYVERQNLTMRMSMRRFTRLTNGFSKKLENHIAAISLHFMYYNFVRTHQTLRMTPAMAAGVVDSPMEVADIIRIMEEFEVENEAIRKAEKAEQAGWYGEASGSGRRAGRS
jgi:IS1 family transposase